MGLKGLEKIFPILGAAPVDLNDGAITGAYASFANYKRCLILLLMGDGTAGNDVDMALYQATDSSGTGAKVLNALETGRIYTMYGADLATYKALSGWTKVTQGTADEKYEPTDNGEAVGIMALEIQDTDLDADNGFNHIRCDLTDPGAAKIGALIYLLLDPRYPAAPENMVSPY